MACAMLIYSKFHSKLNGGTCSIAAVLFGALSYSILWSMFMTVIVQNCTKKLRHMFLVSLRGVAVCWLSTWLDYSGYSILPSNSTCPLWKFVLQFFIIQTDCCFSCGLLKRWKPNESKIRIIHGNPHRDYCKHKSEKLCNFPHYFLKIDINSNNNWNTCNTAIGAVSSCSSLLQWLINLYRTNCIGSV